MDDERRMKPENLQRLKEIIAASGINFTIEERERDYAYISTKAATLSVAFDTYSKKISFAGRYPQNLFGDSYTQHTRNKLPHLYVRIDRDAKSIGKALARWLINVIEETVDANEWVEKELITHEHMTILATALAEAGNGKLNDLTRNGKTYGASGTFKRDEKGYSTWDAKVDYRDGVNLEIRYIPVELAEKLLTMAVDFYKQPKA